MFAHAGHSSAFRDKRPFVSRFWRLFAWAWLVFLSQPVLALAGDFSINWGTAPFTWTAGATGPTTFTITDQYGFQIQARVSIARTGGTAVAGYPDDLSGFGTQTSLWLVWDAASGSSGVGESTNTATLEILSGGLSFATNGITFRVPDIDATDNNDAADRCDFVTLTGNAGNPTLSYVGGTPSTRSVIIGPGAGSGSTSTLSANQAQCVYNTGTTTSPTSSGDDLGTVLATYPTGTHTATVAYDESIENVYGVSSRDAAARGIGVFSAGVVTVNNTISLAKSTTTTSYSSAGQIITYTYTVTNNGPLPINTGQNIEIQDDKIGTFTCGSISSAIPSGGTHNCTTTYTVTTTDTGNTNITNHAVAGVGTGTQSFATRLQSNTATVTVPNTATFTLAKSVDHSSIGSATTLTYAIVAKNISVLPLTGTVLADTLTQGASALSLTSGPTLAPGSDADGDGIFDPGETWTYTATYAATATNISNGADLVNVAVLTTNEAGSKTAVATTTITPPAFACSGNMYASPNIISGSSGTTTCTTTGSTGETGEYNVSGTGALETVWYQWTAPASGTVTFETCSSADTNFDTTLGLFQGGFGSGNLLASNDDTTGCATTGSSGLASRISYAATSGQTYRIQVDGYGNNDGNFRLTWSMPIVQAAISKSVDKSSVSTTGTLTYTIVVDNTGNQNLTSPVLSDQLKQGATALTLASGPVLIAGDANTDGILQPTETWIYSATYLVTQANLDNGVNLVNTATFASALTSAISASATTTLGGLPNLSIVKTATLAKAPGNTLSGVAQVGDTINYQYDVTNTGTFTFTNVEVADVHNATGSLPDPVHIALTDNSPTGDSTDTNADPTIWGRLAPGDKIRFASSYTVTQTDQDTLY